MKARRFLFIIASFATIASCGTDDKTGASAKHQGTEGAACFPNGTCMDGLVCLSNLCVDAGGSGGTAGVAGVAGAGGTAGAGAGGAAGIAGSGAGGTGLGCPHVDDVDHDGDGWSHLDGDCNDCDPGTNPGAYDFVGDGVDENCSGSIDDEPTSCDTGLAIDSGDALDAARALGLCVEADANAMGADRGWGVISAAYVLADGTGTPNPLSHGLLTAFGAANVQHGETLLALSTGNARAPGDPDFQPSMNNIMGTSSDPPAGHPATPACPAMFGADCNDPIGLQVKVRVPTNANSFRFDFNFYSTDFPGYTCTSWNDIFLTMLPYHNISFDHDGNPISVNNALLRVCEPFGYYACPLGVDLLTGTGFEGHAATGWVRTTAPVEPGSELDLLFVIWDSDDSVLDSTVLIDNFTWSSDTVVTYSTEPVASPS